MAAGPQLDGPGKIKLETLGEAMVKLQSLHALVERMAVEQRANKPISGMTMQLKRIAAPLQGQLKMQFGLIADLVTSMLLIAGRGGPDAIRLRAFREHVAQIRTQMEIAIVQTKEKHTLEEGAEAEKSDAD